MKGRPNSQTAECNRPSRSDSHQPASTKAGVVQGNRTRVIQAPGVSGFNFATVTTFDPLSRLKDSTDARSGRTLFGYNGREDLTQLSDPRSLVTQYLRDGLGQTSQLISPDTGVATQTYDAAGNLKTRTDSRGVLATYSYDALNRLTGGVYTRSGMASVAYGWTYDQSGAGFSNGIGRLTTSTYPAGSEKFAYDALGRLSSATVANATPLVTAYEYDAAGNVAAITYPSGHKLFITYSGGKPWAMSIANSAGGTPVPLISAIQYEPFGGVSSWQWQLAGGGTQLHRRQYDPEGRAVRYRLGNLLRDLTYDSADRITAYTHYDAASGAAAPAANQYFAYDELGRITGVATAAANWSIGYDANGNRTGLTLGGTTSAYTTDSASNRLIAVSNPARSLAYDATGNTTSDSGAPAYSGVYDASDRLVNLSVTTSATTASFYSFTYNDRGQRLTKKLSGGQSCSGGTCYYFTVGGSPPNQFVYDQQGHLIGEYGYYTGAEVEYVWLGDTPIAVLKPDPASAANPPLIYFVHADHLEAPRVVIDRANNIRWTRLAEPFGTTPANDNPAGLGAFSFNLRQPGQYWDAESGLHYNMARYYDPGIGRYTQSDPIGLEGGINTYAYVGGNPISGIDPYGLFDITNPADWPTIPQGVVNACAGFGDGVSLGATAGIRGLMGTNDAVDFSSPEYLGGLVAGVAVTTRGYATGAELSIGRNFRIAPWGNRTGHPTGQYPHYHRRGAPDANGNTPAGQGIGRHRPWDKKSTDQCGCDRF